MFAVFETGGKQYLVKKGDVIAIEKLTQSENETVEFNKVCLAGSATGTPYVENAKVVAKVLKQFKSDKVIVFKKKRRQNYRRKKGHRQNLTTIQIQDIITS